MKLALQIGITYLGTDGQLNGTATDVERFSEVLVDYMGYRPENMVLLAEDAAYTGPFSVLPPTRQNIVDQLLKLAEKANANEDVTEIFFQYSGHGTYVRDTGADEDDGRDECLVPLDYDQNGFILDDTISSVLALFPERVTFVGVVDACHSGSMFDLPYVYKAGIKREFSNNSTNRIKCRCIMISGCRDNQVSMDAYNLSGAEEFSGAMSTSMLAALHTHNYTINIFDLQKHMWRFLRKRKFRQRPQITTNVHITRDTLFVNCNRTRPFIA